MDLATARRRTALFLLFFVPGMGISSWVTRTPAIRDLLGASTAEMGLVLFGLSAGSMVGILGSAALVARFGTRPVITVGASLAALSTPAIGLGGALHESVVVAAGLFLFGLGMGGGEVAMNIEGAEIERIIGRAVLPTLHGFFSLGTVAGATIGMTLTALAFPAPWHLLIVGLLSIATVLPAVRQIPPGVARTSIKSAETKSAEPAPAVGASAVTPSAVSTSAATASAATASAATASGAGSVAPSGKASALWRDRRLVLIGVLVLAMALAEGAANDWLPLLMVDGHGFAASVGSAVYVGFAAAMTVGRFTGDFFLSRFGRAAVLRVGALIGGLGIALVVWVDNQIVAAAAVVLWGLGAALGFPVALSAAGDSGDNPAARVSLVATVGYVAFLVGPPALGFLGEHYGLRGAMIVVLLLVAGAAFVAGAAGPAPTRTDTTEPADPART